MSGDMKVRTFHQFYILFHNVTSVVELLVFRELNVGDQP